MTFVALLLSYVLGSVPTGLWLGLKLRGIDIRQHGSKNIGATNTMRILGKRLGAVALAGDMLKGAVPVLLLSRMGTWEYLPIACGVAAILGHTFSLFLRFKGGKGVATGAGVFLALAPLPTLIAAITWATVVYTTRMAAAGSMLAAIALCIALYAMRYPLYICVIATAIAVLIIWKHRTNITRILSGTENKI